jgi:hypothetical protein
MTERERRLLLRQRPDVESWSSVLVGKQDANASKRIKIGDVAR